MSDQTKNDTAFLQTAPQKTVQATRFGARLVVIMLGVIALVVGVACYYLSTVNRSLLHTATAAKEEAVSANQQVAALQQSIVQLQQEVKKAQEMAMEKAASQPDDQVTTDLYTRLLRFDEALQQLPFGAVAKPAEVQTVALVSENAATDENTASWWQKGINRAMALLNKVVKVSYVGEQMPALISPDDKTFVYRDLHTQIEAAMWATLHKNPEVYQASLARAEQLIQRYFTSEAPATQNALQELALLRNIQMTASAHVDAPSQTSDTAAASVAAEGVR